MAPRRTRQQSTAGGSPLLQTTRAALPSAAREQGLCRSTRGTDALNSTACPAGQEAHRGAHAAPALLHQVIGISCGGVLPAAQHSAAQAGSVQAGQQRWTAQQCSCRQVESRVGGTAAATAASFAATKAMAAGTGCMQQQGACAACSPSLRRPKMAAKGRSPAVLRHRRHAALRAAGAHKAEALVLHIAPHCQACSNSDCKACGAAEGASRARQGLSWAAAGGGGVAGRHISSLAPRGGGWAAQ